MAMDTCTLSPAPDHLLAVHRHAGAGYRALVDYGAWRVALLNYGPELRLPALTRMQRHDETDEVFVLLRGRCLLFVAEGGDTPGAIHAEDLRPGLVYNVRRGVWHTHTVSEDAQVLVVENRDTTCDNSPFAALTPAQCRELARLCRLAWGGPPEPPPCEQVGSVR